MSSLGRPPLGIRLTLASLGAVVFLAAASGTFARMSVPQPEPTPTPLVRTYEASDVVGCDGAEPAWPRGGQTDHSCRVLGVPPTGAQPTTWRLDPSVQFNPDAAEIHVLIRSEAICPLELEGLDLAEYVDQDVDYYDRRVVVTLQLWWPMVRGWGICDLSQPPDRPWLPYTLHLPEPVGNRDLVDGEPDPMTLIAPAR